MRIRIRVLLMACLCAWMASASAAPLTVAVKASPPFSFQNGDRWDGVSVELWEQVAKSAGYEYRFRPYKTVADMLTAVELGQADVAIGAISVTADRERRH